MTEQDSPGLSEDQATPLASEQRDTQPTLELFHASRDVGRNATQSACCTCHAPLADDALEDVQIVQAHISHRERYSSRPVSFWELRLATRFITWSPVLTSRLPAPEHHHQPRSEHGLAVALQVR